MGNQETNDRSRDLELGMDRNITRRDFLNGMAVGAGGLLAGPRLQGLFAPQTSPASAQDQPGYYPPTRTGMRGSHPGAFEVAHALRDGTFWETAGKPVETGEEFDLIVVGGGISGLASAYFYRKQAGLSARILVLDNHDDFGGHAKRNEFHLDGRLQLLNGGTLGIDSPRPYAPVPAGLIRELGIDVVGLKPRIQQTDFYRSLGLKSAIFLDRETFGGDKLLVGAGIVPIAQLLADAPLSARARREIVQLETGNVDYLPGLSSAQKKD